MSYENLARKYRPQRFEEVAGQEPVTRTLSNSLKLSRVAHAYLFFGPRGCGKTTMARILAKALNCHKGLSSEPCNKCVSCREITEGKALDVLEIDAASHTQVDKVREVIIETVALVPSRDRYKVFILDEAHMLSTASFNALLKTIEEPPPHVVFMLATTEQMKIPATISSRCQGFRFKPLSLEVISERLKEVVKKEKLHADSEALDIIAASASGSMRDALTLLDRTVSFSGGKIDRQIASELAGQVQEDLLKTIALAVLDRNGALLHETFERVVSEGCDVLTLLRDLRNTFAGIFLSASGFSKRRGRLESELAGGRPSAVFGRLARRVGRIIDETRSSDAQAIVAELGLFSLLEAPADIEAWVRRLESLESRLSGAETAPQMPQQADLKPRHHEGGRALHTNGVQALHTAGGQALHTAGGQALHTAGGQAKSAPVHPDNNAPELSGPGQADSGASDGTLWNRLLEGLTAKNPMLHDILASCRVLYEGRDKWKLIFAVSFHRDTVERSRARLETMLRGLSGRTISLALETGPSSGAHAHVEEITCAGAAGGQEEDGERAPDVPGSRWLDISGDAIIESDPGIKKVLKVFPGKVRKIPKK